MSVAALALIDVRAFDGTAGSIGHGKAGRTLVEEILALQEKANEIAEAIDALPLTDTVLSTPTELTIATGSITITQNYHTVDTEGDAASDDLDTIVVTDIPAGTVVYLRPVNDGRTVVVRHIGGGTGNIRTSSGQSVTMAEDEDVIALQLDPSGVFWDVLFAKTLAFNAVGLGAKHFATIADPGTAAAIPVTQSGICEMTIANAAETNTLAIPTYEGQRLVLSVASLAGTGTRAVTVAQSIDEGGTTVITLRATTDVVILQGVKVAGVLRWRKILDRSNVVIADPGTAAAIPVTQSGILELTIANAAETNTLAIPTFAGQQLTICVASLAGTGTRAITFAQAYDDGGSVLMTFRSTLDVAILRAVKIAGALRWRRQHLVDSAASIDQITDPGNAGAIPVLRSGHMELVSAGAETRTIAAPGFKGQRLHLSMKTDGGDIVITVATSINQTGNTTITMNDAGDAIELVAKRNGNNLRWSVAFNDGCTLG